MDYVKLGNTGLEVSRICLGCMSYGRALKDYAKRDEVRLSADEVLSLEEPYIPHPVLGFQ